MRGRQLSAADRFINRYFWWIQGVLFIALLLLLLLGWQAFKPPFDLIITGGRVFDGERFLRLPRDVGIRNGRVEAIGFLTGARANNTIDAHGRVVAPGFIDTHVHVEASMLMGRPFRAPNFVKMGVTTVVTGNCGTSHKQLRDILNSLDRKGGHVNIVTLVGHNTIREQVMGMQDSGPPSPEQLDAMRSLVEDAMRAGAYGLSTGLQYAPGTFSARDEVVSLAEVAERYGGLYATHVRDEGNGLMASLEEAVDICKKAQIPLHISHLKRASKRDWRTMPEVLTYLAGARPGLPALTQDVYAYTRSSSSLDLLLPSEFRGMLTHSRTILADQVMRKRLVQGMLAQLQSDNFNDYQFARIAWYHEESFWGKDIPDLLVPASWREENKWVRDVVKDGALAEQVQNVLYLFSHGGAQMIYEVMDESDMMAVLKDSYTSIGSDSGVKTAESTTTHPRGIGNFPKIIGDLVRENKLTLEEALRKMTLQPAMIFGLSDRGRLKEGMPADIVVFDPDLVSGPADYNKLEDPRGIEFVLVNGEVVAQYGEVEARFPGRPLRKRNESPIGEEPPAVEPKKVEPPPPPPLEPKVETPPPLQKHQPIVPEAKKPRKGVAHAPQKSKRHKANLK
jgi:N-acyl-D-aspartate/D-glutamate deacylase